MSNKNQGQPGQVWVHCNRDNGLRMVKLIERGSPSFSAVGLERWKVAGNALYNTADSRLSVLLGPGWTRQEFGKAEQVLTDGTRTVKLKEHLDSDFGSEAWRAVVVAEGSVKTTHDHTTIVVLGAGTDWRPVLPVPTFEPKENWGKKGDVYGTPNRDVIVELTTLKRILPAIPGSRRKEEWDVVVLKGHLGCDYIRLYGVWQKLEREELSKRFPVQYPRFGGAFALGVPLRFKKAYRFGRENLLCKVTRYTARNAKTLWTDGKTSWTYTWPKDKLDGEMEMAPPTDTIDKKYPVGSRWCKSPKSERRFSDDHVYLVVVDHKGTGMLPSDSVFVQWYTGKGEKLGGWAAWGHEIFGGNFVPYEGPAKPDRYPLQARFLDKNHIPDLGSVPLSYTLVGYVPNPPRDSFPSLKFVEFVGAFPRDPVVKDEDYADKNMIPFKQLLAFKHGSKVTLAKVPMDPQGNRLMGMVSGVGDEYSTITWYPNQGATFQTRQANGVLNILLTEFVDSVGKAGQKWGNEIGNVVTLLRYLGKATPYSETSKEEWEAECACGSGRCAKPKVAVILPGVWTKKS